MNATTDLLDEPKTIDLRAVFTELWAKRVWMAASILIAATIFAVVAFTMTPVYRAATLLIPAGAERESMSGALSSALGQLGGLASLAGLGGSNDQATDEALAVLRSREFTSRFLADKKLIPVLFAKKWDAQTGNWRAGEGPISEARAYRYFDKKIRSVVQDKKTGFVTLEIEWTDRNAAAAWANELVDRLNEEMRRRAIEKADASLRYLEKELTATQVVEVRAAINRLVETQVKQRMLANVTQEFSFRVVDKAVAPDGDSPERPNKVLLLLVGPIVGFGVGAVVILLSGSLANGRRH